MPLFRDQSQKGRHIKIGVGFVKLSDIVSSSVVVNAGRRELRVVRRGNPPLVYAGKFADYLKSVLDVEIPKEAGRIR